MGLLGICCTFLRNTGWLLCDSYPKKIVSNIFYLIFRAVALTFAKQKARPYRPVRHVFIRRIRLLCFFRAQRNKTLHPLFLNRFKAFLPLPQLPLVGVTDVRRSHLSFFDGVYCLAFCNNYCKLAFAFAGDHFSTLNQQI